MYYNVALDKLDTFSPFSKLMSITRQIQHPRNIFLYLGLHWTLYERFTQLLAGSNLFLCLLFQIGPILMYVPRLLVRSDLFKCRM